MIIKANSDNTLPYFAIDEMNGIIEIKGRSISTEVDEFFEPIIDYLKNYLLYNPMDITFNVKLEYFNTKTSRVLLNIFKLLKNIDEDYNLIINWFYDEDDDDKQAGEDYEDIIKVKFNYIPN